METEVSSGRGRVRFVVNVLVGGLEIERTLAYNADALAKIQALTKADIKRVLERRLRSAQFVELKAGDLEKVEP